MKPDVKKIRKMLLSETSSDGSILKRAGTSLSELCEYIENLERVSDIVIEIIRLRSQNVSRELAIELGLAMYAIGADLSPRTATGNEEQDEKDSHE